MYHSVASVLLPANAIEEEIVRQIAHAQYNLHRLGAIEIGALDLEILRRLNDDDDQVPGRLNENQLQALAFESLAGKANVLNLLDRYQARHFRQYHRALKALSDLRKSHRTNPSPGPGRQYPGAHLPWTDPNNRTPAAIARRMALDRQTNPAPASEDAPLQPFDGEFGGVGDRHHGHHPCLDGVRDH